MSLTVDADYKPATAADYTYKRVFKYKEPILNPNLGFGYYGNVTTNLKSKPTGLHYCTLTDYYKTGEIALVGKVLATDLGCTQRGGFDGQVVAYYKNGNIKRREPWSSGKLSGNLIFYDEVGNETKREEYVNGKLLEDSKFSAPADSPLLGTRKYVEYTGGVKNEFFNVPPSVKSSITITYNQNGVLEATFQNGLSRTKEKRNWKYTPKSSSSGVSEEYLGGELVERGNIRWINENQFEYTLIYHVNTNAIEHQTVFTRQ